MVGTIVITKKNVTTISYPYLTHMRTKQSSIGISSYRLYCSKIRYIYPTVVLLLVTFKLPAYVFSNIFSSSLLLIFSSGIYSVLLALILVSQKAALPLKAKDIIDIFILGVVITSTISMIKYLANLDPFILYGLHLIFPS